MPQTKDEDPPFGKQHPGFTIECLNCGSQRITVDNSLGYSATSGSWGSVDLMCDDCGNSTEIVSA
jgi:hypothetical protein